MQILEHQSVFLRNLISYRLHLPREKTPHMLRYIMENIESLGVQLSGAIFFTEDRSQYRNIEILIPVDRELEFCAQYDKKPAFRLLDAVSVRHEGSITEMEKTEQKLLDYAKRKAYEVTTQPYFHFIRTDPDDPEYCIADIYIGVNCTE
jgi:effector-binding domain-containing protein